eukprot:CAMPEP_0172319396 /NCGR_PEP_ID=MMETSP1058-20130122/37529_1 /TAXON_ID=83371 /ORGANISM="Detonula confervacea, Strain CCMP 353" /LENGTH=163 /DNA_ID=CAMNT_0013034423 /DNA_START=211 /DNA_END=699 /DNA_ORIENTATION=-
MQPLTKITPIPYTNEGGLVKSDSFSDSTDLSSSSSDDDSAFDESSSILSLDASTRQGHKKSVRFSIVHIREFNVVDELPPQDHDYEEDEDEPLRRSLGWEYTESKIDIETHMEEAKKERKQTYLMMIQDHIHKVEFEKEEREKNRQEKIKKKGFKSKVLKPLW